MAVVCSTLPLSKNLIRFVCRTFPEGGGQNSAKMLELPTKNVAKLSNVQSDITFRFLISSKLYFIIELYNSF